MTTTIGSLDLNAFSDLYSDSNQYFWFESDATATYGAGAHVTLVPDTSFISNPTGQNILMNTEGFSIRNGLLPMMTLDNDSLDFNIVDTTAGTYVTTATFTSTGAQIGQSTGAHLELNTNEFSIRNGSLPMMTLDNDSLDFNAVDTTAGTYVTTATFSSTGAQIGSNNGVHAVISSKSFGLKDDKDISMFECNSSGTTMLVENAIYPEPNDYKVGFRAYYLPDTIYAGSDIYVYYRTPSMDYDASVFFSEGTSSTKQPTGNITISYDASNQRIGVNSLNNVRVSKITYIVQTEAPTLIFGSLDGNPNPYSAYLGEWLIPSGYSIETVVGSYNKTETGGLSKLFVVGNGTSDFARSNALTVDWSGDVCLALDTTAASGTTDGDLYAAITALSWQSDVIV